MKFSPTVSFKMLKRSTTMSQKMMTKLKVYEIIGYMNRGIAFISREVKVYAWL